MTIEELQSELDKAKLALTNKENELKELQTKISEFDNSLKNKDDELAKAQDNLVFKDLVIDTGAKDVDYLQYKYEKAKGENFKRDEFIEEMKKNKNIVGDITPPNLSNPPSGGKQPDTINYKDYMMLDEGDRAKYKPNQINYKG